MAIYAIGDVQGCFAEFLQLLDVIDFSPSRDRLWLAGDLVNRGADSLGMLRWVAAHQDAVNIVLGNHDLHLIVVAEGYGRGTPNASLLPILNAPDGREWVTWLRHQPLMHVEQVDGHAYAMVHAGLLPEWSIAQAKQLADEVSAALTGEDYRHILAHLYGDYPTRWQEDLCGIDRVRCVVNAMTRMRLLTSDGAMDLSCKSPPLNAPSSLRPWFEASQRKWGSHTVVCGHWSALGLHLSSHVLAIDTGCLWGGQLTALRLSDRHIVQLPCPMTRRPNV